MSSDVNFSEAMSLSSKYFDQYTEKVADLLLSGQTSKTLHGLIAGHIARLSKSELRDTITALLLERAIDRAAELGTMKDDEHDRPV